MKTLLIVLLCVCSSALAQNPEYKNLADYLDRLSQIEADFVQHTFDGKDVLLQTQSGNLLLKHPNKFRWASAEPFAQLLVSDGSTLWQYDEDLEQVTVQALNTELSATPALLLSGNAEQIASEYDIYSEKMQDEEHFVLIPKKADVLFDRLRLEFNQAKWLARMVIQDEVGQKTIIRFNNIQAKPQLKDADFVFQIPAGIDVIRNE